MVCRKLQQSSACEGWRRWRKWKRGKRDKDLRSVSTSATWRKWNECRGCSDCILVEQSITKAERQSNWRRAGSNKVIPVNSLRSMDARLLRLLSIQLVAQSQHGERGLGVR